MTTTDQLNHEEQCCRCGSDDLAVYDGSRWLCYGCDDIVRPGGRKFGTPATGEFAAIERVC